MTKFKVLIFLSYFIVQLSAVPKFQPISSVNLRPTTTWIPGPNNNKYQFHNGWQSWLSAREFCLSQNADLVSINNDEKLEWILKHYANDITGVGERQIQIGLFLPSTDFDDWVWTDKSPFNNSLLRFDNSKLHNKDKKCSVLLINKKILQPVMCDIAINLPDRPIRFICERSNENHMALEKANNPLWDKFDRILQFLGISDGNGTEEVSKKKDEKKKDDYYSDDSEYDSREFDKNKNDKKEKLVLLSIVDSKDPKNLKVTREFNSEGSGVEVTNDFEGIETRKPEDISSSTPIIKTTKSVIGEISDMVDVMKKIINLGLDDDKTPVTSDDFSDEFDINSRSKQNQDRSLGLIKVSPTSTHNLIPPKSRPIINRAINIVKHFDSYGSEDNDYVDYQIIDNKLDILTDEGNKKLVQIPGVDVDKDNEIIGDNLVSEKSKLTTIDDIKNHDIEGSGEDLIKVNHLKTTDYSILKSNNLHQKKYNTTVNDIIENENTVENSNLSGQLTKVGSIENLIKDDEEKDVIEFFKSLYVDIKLHGVGILEHKLGRSTIEPSLVDYYKEYFQKFKRRDDIIKVLDRLHEIKQIYQKVQKKNTNSTIKKELQNAAIITIEEQLNKETIKEFNKEVDERYKSTDHSQFKKINSIKKIVINGGNQTVLHKPNPVPSSAIIRKTKIKSKKSRELNGKKRNSKKDKMNRKNKKIRKNKNKTEVHKQSPTVIGEWHPELPPTTEQKKQFDALEKSRVKLNNDTYDIFKNFNENERTKKLLERIHQHELQKKLAAEKEAIKKVSKNKSQEVNHNDVDGLLNLVSKTDKTVKKFIDTHN